MNDIQSLRAGVSIPWEVYYQTSRGRKMREMSKVQAYKEMKKNNRGEEQRLFSAQLPQRKKL